MEEITTARLMTEAEIKSLIDWREKKREEEQEAAKVVIGQNIDSIIKEYDRQEEECLKEYQELQHEYYRIFMAAENNICYCHEPLNNATYGFRHGKETYLECSSIKNRFEQDIEGHFSMTAKAIEYNNSRINDDKVKIPFRWAIDIAKNCNIKVKQIPLIKHLISIGKPDLRHKYGLSTVFEQTSTRTSVKERANSQEVDVINWLGERFNKTSEQVYFKYLAEGAEKEKIGIMDAVFSDYLHIYVCEVKNSASDIDENQLRRYVHAMAIIAKSKGDEREVKGFFVTFNDTLNYNDKFTVPHLVYDPGNGFLLEEYTLDFVF